MEMWVCGCGVCPRQHPFFLANWLADCVCLACLFHLSFLGSSVLLGCSKSLVAFCDDLGEVVILDVLLDCRREPAVRVRNPGMRVIEAYSGQPAQTTQKRISWSGSTRCWRTDSMMNSSCLQASARS
jgi:hypothetical protein